MIKTILVPMGDSIFSFNSLNFALSLANILKANLRLFYVKDIRKIKQLVIAQKSMGGVSLDIPGKGNDDREINNIWNQIEKEKAEVEKYYNEVKDKIENPHELVVKDGDFIEEILKESRTADLIVMGKVLKGKGNDCKTLQEGMLKIIYETRVPLFAVCSEKMMQENVLLAYDGSSSANKALRVIGDLAGTIIKKVSVLCVKGRESEASPLLEEAELYLSPYGITIEKIWKSGDVTQNIITVMEDKKSFSIVMGGHGDNVIKDIFVGSTAERVLESVEIPVLVCNK